MTAYVIVDDCVPKDLYLCVRDQCARTVASVKANLLLMLRPYYIQLHPHSLESAGPQINWLRDEYRFIVESSGCPSRLQSSVNDIIS